MAKSAANMPWSIKGVSQDARALAKKAASERGVPIGEWLSEVIRSTESLDPDPPDPMEIGAAGGDGDVASLVLGGESDLEESLEFGEEPGAGPSGSAMTDDLRGRLEDLNRRAEQAEQWALSRAEPLQDAVLRLTRRLERLQSRVGRRLEQEKQIVAGLDVPAGERRESAEDGLGNGPLIEAGEPSSLAERLAAEDKDWARRRNGEDW